MRNIRILDTTLRDGEQAPGYSMNTREKIEVARQLEKMGVNAIEAGFAVISKGDADSVAKIAKEVHNAYVCSLARALRKDIDAAADAVRGASLPMIHTFLATSDIHLEYKLKKTRTQALETISEAVNYAKKFVSEVEFSAEDATRTDIDFLCQAVSAAIKAGATVINIPDTVGYATPDEIAYRIKYLREHVENIDKVCLSTHCHDDLGLAVANSLAAINAGVQQVEGTINGIGERAGNAALEEIIMTLHTKKELYGAETSVNTKEISRTSKLVQMVTGVNVSPSKSIVGANAFLHEAGIHQHGMLENPLTYEIITPETVGATSSNSLVIGKHSGRHAFDAKIKELGYDLSEEMLGILFEDFKNLADKKKDIHDRDIEALILKAKAKYNEHMFRLVHFVITCGDAFSTIASVTIEQDGKTAEGVSDGDGPIDAAFKAIEKSIGLHFQLLEFSITAVTGGKDALGTAKVRLRYESKEITAVGISTDIVEASIYAYLNAVNELVPELKLKL